jgi:hypothetical protein
MILQMIFKYICNVIANEAKKSFSLIARTPRVWFDPSFEPLLTAFNPFLNLALNQASSFISVIFLSILAYLVNFPLGFPLEIEKYINLKS